MNFSSSGGSNPIGTFSENLDEHVLNSSYFRRSDVAIPLPFRSSAPSIPIVTNCPPGTESNSELRFPLVLPSARHQSDDNNAESSDTQQFEGSQSTEINLSCSDLDLNIEPSNFLNRRTKLERFASLLCSPHEPRPYAPLQAVFISQFVFYLAYYKHFLMTFFLFYS